MFLNHTLRASTLAMSVAACGAASGLVLVEDNFDSANGGTGWAAASSWNSPVAGGELLYAGANESRQFAAPIAVPEYWVSITWEQTGTEQSFMSAGAWQTNSGQPYFLGFHETFDVGNSTQPRFPVEFAANAAPNGGYNTILMHVTNVIPGTSFDYELWSFAGDGSTVDPNSLGAPNWMSGTRNTANTAPDRWRIIGGLSVEFDRMAIATTAGEALVPEPSSMALLALGGVVMLKRRRRS